jgi:hypothetical protein
LDKFDLVETVSECVEVTREQMLYYNRLQLLHGLDQEGNYLSPKYSEDPYFKSPESAKRYAEWKSRIEPKTDKPFDVPNLYITGRYHESIEIDVEPSKYVISSSDPNAASIENKFTQKVYGLSPDYKAIYIEEHLFDELKGRINSKLGFKFG